MSLNIFVLPLLAGYIFINFCDAFRLFHQNIDRQKLIYNSSLAGLAYLVLSYLLLEVYSLTCLHPFMAVEQRYKSPSLGVSIGAVLLAVLHTVFTNLLFRFKVQVTHKQPVAGSLLSKLMHILPVRAWRSRGYPRLS